MKYENVFDNLLVSELLKLWDALPFYVMLIDAHHRVLFANDITRESLGVNLRELIGNYCPRVVHESDEPIPECPLEKAHKTGEATEVEYFDQKFGRWVKSAIYPTNVYLPGKGKIYCHFVQDIDARKKAELELEKHYQQIQKMMEGIINTVLSMVEGKDPYTAAHQRRVSKLAVAIAREIGLDEKEIEGLRVAGLLHDIGKFYVPSEILSKPGKLDTEEWNLIKKHPTKSYETLKNNDFPWPVTKIVYQHHERIDGSGYPQGLLGDEIIWESKILAVADVVEAISSHRPYRSARKLDSALKELKNNRGILYEPKIVDACLKVFKKGFKFD